MGEEGGPSASVPATGLRAGAQISGAPLGVAYSSPSIPVAQPTYRPSQSTGMGRGKAGVSMPILTPKPHLWQAGRLVELTKCTGPSNTSSHFWYKGLGRGKSAC